jgi:ferric-dicitrate binding protein FerR (iron transport regulator)
MLLVVLWQNQGPDWKVIGLNGVGTVAIDGQTMDPGDLSALEAALRSGTGIALEDGAELTLLSAGTLVVQAASGSRFSIPNPPGRWFGDAIRTRVDGGEVRFLTGPDFPGRRLEVATVEGRVEVTGTVISVLRDTGLTCVCVMSGTARVGMNDDDMDPIPAGMRKVMFGDGREPLIVDILPEHRQGLQPFVQRYRDFLEPETPPAP